MDRGGYTLIEAAIAMLLTAIMAGSVFSVALTAKRSSGRGLRKLILDQASRQLSEQLKNYVTADKSASTIGGINGPGNGANKWSMTDASAGTGQAPPEIWDSCSASDPTNSTNNCYALEPGSHTLKGYLPKWLEDDPYKAKMKYWVEDRPLVDGLIMPKVIITATWKEL